MTLITFTQDMPYLNYIKPGQLPQLKLTIERQFGQIKSLNVLASFDKSKLLIALAKTYQFPSSFGSNFDAVYDGLTDQTLMFLGLQVLCIDGLKDAKITTMDRETFLDVLSGVAKFWNDLNVQFLVYIVE